METFGVPSRIPTRRPSDESSSRIGHRFPASDPRADGDDHDQPSYDTASRPAPVRRRDAILFRNRAGKRRYGVRVSAATVGDFCAATGLLKDCSMQDIIWIAIMLGLLAATLAYVRLCDSI